VIHVGWIGAVWRGKGPGIVLVCLTTTIIEFDDN